VVATQRLDRRRRAQVVRSRSPCGRYSRPRFRRWLCQQVRCGWRAALGRSWSSFLGLVCGWPGSGDEELLAARWSGSLAWTVTVGMTWASCVLTWPGPCSCSAVVMGRRCLTAGRSSRSGNGGLPRWVMTAGRCSASRSFVPPHRCAAAAAAPRPLRRGAAKTAATRRPSRRGGCDQRERNSTPSCSTGLR
jgi:hypothetical protein